MGLFKKQTLKEKAYEIFEEIKRGAPFCFPGKISDEEFAIIMGFCESFIDYAKLYNTYMYKKRQNYILEPVNSELIKKLEIYLFNETNKYLKKCLKTQMSGILKKWNL